MGLVSDAFEDAEASREVEAMLARLDPADLPRLDEESRSSLHYIRQQHVEQLPWHLLAVLSFHPSGYVREEAVRELARRRSGSELPYLLLRLNDWVPQVRDAARQAVVRRMTEEDVPAFARNYVLVDRLTVAGRADHSELLQALSRLLGSESARDAMLAAANTSSPAGARAIFKLLLPSESREVLDAGLQHADPIIRVWSLRAAARVIPTEELQRFQSDPAPAVRREALLIFGANEDALLDASASVRDTARVLLKDVDFAAIYRNAIHTPKLATALAGLAETGRATDAEVALPYLTHASAGVRRAALKCAIRLGGQPFVDRVAPMLQDASRSVSGAARAMLAPHATTLGSAQLTRMFHTSADEHVRRNVLHLMKLLPKWESLLCLLGAAAFERKAVEAIKQWLRNYNRRQTVPSARELDELAAALVAARTSVDEELLRMIRFCIEAFPRR